jgi:hypothetical protein
MVDKELLSRKLSQLREYLAALRNTEDITWKKYEKTSGRGPSLNVTFSYASRRSSTSAIILYRFTVGANRRDIGIYSMFSMKTASSRKSI